MKRCLEGIGSTSGFSCLPQHLLLETCGSQPDFRQLARHRRSKDANKQSTQCNNSAEHISHPHHEQARLRLRSVKLESVAYSVTTWQLARSHKSARNTSGHQLRLAHMQLSDCLQAAAQASEFRMSRPNKCPWKKKVNVFLVVVFAHPPGSALVGSLLTSLGPPRLRVRVRLPSNRQLGLKENPTTPPTKSNEQATVLNRMAGNRGVSKEFCSTSSSNKSKQLAGG